MEPEKPPRPPVNGNVVSGHGSSSGKVAIAVSDTTPLLQARANSNLRRGSAMIDVSKVARQLGPNGVQDDAGHGHNMGGGTIGSAMFNLSNTIIGAGIMGLPSILKVLGIPLGIVTMIVIGMLSEYSLQRLLKCTIYASAWSFGDLMNATYGRFGRGLLRACIIVHNIGILIVYLVIIGDVLCGSTSGDQHYPGLFEEWAGGQFWWNSRVIVVSFFAVSVIGPLVSLTHIDSLQVTSGLSIFLAVSFVVITIVVASLNLIDGDIDWASLRWYPPGFGGTQVDIWRLFSIIPTVGTAFTCHYNLHPVLVELTPPREEKMKKALTGTFTLCTSVYCVTALFGYMLFGEATYSDVLANFDRDLNLPYSQVIDDVVRLFYAVHLMLVFPVINFSLRASLDAVVFPQGAPLAEDRARCLFVSAVLLFTILTLSLLVPDVQFAFQFVGSAGAATIAFTLPGLISLSDEAGARTTTYLQYSMGVMLFVLGLTVTVTGLTSNFHSLFVK